MRPQHIALATLCTTLLSASGAHAQLSTAWITQYGTSANEGGSDLAVDSTGQIWVTGFSNGPDGLGGFLSHISPAGSVLSTVSRDKFGFAESHSIALLGNTSIFLGGAGTHSFDGQTSIGPWDNVAVRYTAAGVWQNSVITGSPVNDFIIGLAANSTNVFGVGYTDGSYAAQTNAGNSDAFITKMDATGTPIWTKFLGTSSYERGYGVAVDNAGNSFVSGYTGGSLPGFSNAGSTDWFVAKYDPSGNQTLLVQHGGVNDEEVTAIRVDASGNIYLTGYTASDLDGQTNSGQRDAFLTKLDSTGNVLWTRLFGGASYEYGEAIALDSTGNIWIGGHSDGDLPDHANIGDNDAFLLLYDPAGNLLGTHYITTTNGEGITGIAPLPDGGVIVTGVTAGILSGANAGGDDIFVAKVVPEPGVCGLLMGAIGMLGMRRSRGRRG